MLFRSPLVIVRYVGNILSSFLHLLFPNDQSKKKTITGQVIDENGIPIQGVSVIVKGLHIGTVTSPDGSYSIDIPSNISSLLFSFVGLKSFIQK